MFGTIPLKEALSTLYNDVPMDRSLAVFQNYGVEMRHSTVVLLSVGRAMV